MKPTSEAKIFTPSMINVLYQDDDFVAVSKPSGIHVHPSRESGADKSFLLHLARDRVGQYLYPIHRLDRATSGIIIFGLNPTAISKLQQVWHHKVVKKYLCLCWGELADQGEFSFELQDHNKIKKHALTLYQTLKHQNSYSLMEVEIKTGRRHQIRRHFARTGHHLVNDTRYGKARISNPIRQKTGVYRLFLHAHYMDFIHPTTNKKICLSCPLDSELEQALRELKFL